MALKSKKKEKYDFMPLVNEIVKNVKSYLPSFDKKNFIKAFEFARDAHEGQMRQQNIPYITHPLEAVKILTTLHADETTLIAALLHDVPEDTEKTVEDVEKNFGSEVGFLVEGITKLSKVYYRHNMQGRQVESLKKLLLHSAKDPRVVLIKLADRLHNMRTLEFLKPEKRKRIARETLEIYSPIANLLGIEGIKSELEDLCFRFLHTEDYEAIKKKVARTQKKQSKVLEKMMKIVKSELLKEKIEAQIKGRQKTLYSIYKKIKSDGKKISDMDDRIAMRIIVSSRDDCYIALGIIHSLFKPKPDRFKDRIAVPKNNGYRSIHTTVFGIDGVVTEFQIRTNEMHLDAEYGIAAHYFYKAGEITFDKPKGYTSWAQKILEIQKSQGSDPNFMENLKLDIFQDRIFVFTPKGDVIDLPRGATGVDFAYAIHSDVGNQAVRMEINGENFPLSTTIPNGTTVNVIGSSKQKGPDRKWLSFARTQHARQSIRDYLKKEDRDKRLKRGYKALGKELERIGLDTIESLSFKKINSALQKVHNKTFSDMDSLLIEIGEGSFTAIDVIKALYPNYDLSSLDEAWHWKKFLPFSKKEKNQKAKLWIKISSVEKMGQARKILGVIAKNDINILRTIGRLSYRKDIFIMNLLVEVSSLQELSRLCNDVEEIDGVYKVERVPYKKQFLFYVGAVLTFALWIMHPLMMRALLEIDFDNWILRESASYLGIFLLLGMIYSLKKFSERSFPGSRYLKRLWILAFIIMTVAFITIIGEVYFFRFELNWIILFAVMTFIYALFTAEYLHFINKHENN